MKNKCKKCGKNYNVLTKENLCAYCYKDEFKVWSSEFDNYIKDKKGNLVSRDAPMKFKKQKNRK